MFDDDLIPESKGKGRPAKLPSYNTQVKVKTRLIDTSGCIALRLDHKTTIYLKPGVDPEAIRTKYENRDRDNAAKNSKGKVIPNKKKKLAGFQDFPEPPIEDE